MIDHWKEFAEDEQEDDSVCTNGDACDHPCCPEHSDLEDSQLSEALDELVGDLSHVIENMIHDSSPLTARHTGQAGWSGYGNVGSENMYRTRFCKYRIRLIETEHDVGINSDKESPICAR